MESEFTDPWYSPEWFSLSTLKSFTWENQIWLYGLLAIPVYYVLRFILRALTGYRLYQKLPVALKKTDLKTSFVNYIWVLPEIILMMVAALLIVALARPQKTNEKVEQWTEGIDIMIALDISQSMLIQDFTPDRLKAAKDVALDFINGRVQDRIGLVVFSRDAFSLAPLTTDYVQAPAS